MATETRKVTQYKIYSLEFNKKTEYGQAAIAVFDDMDIVKSFIKASKGLITPQNSRVVDQWTELKPIADNFNLPLNPEFEDFDRSFFVEKKVRPTVAKPSQEAKTDAGEKEVPKEVEAMVGVKIGRRGGQ